MTSLDDLLYPEALRRGHTVTVELRGPLEIDSADETETRLAKHAHRLHLYAARGWFANETDGYMGNSGMDHVSLISKLQERGADFSRIILNVAYRNHTPDEIEAALVAASDAGVRHILAIPGDGDSVYARDDPNALYNFIAIAQPASAQLAFGATINPLSYSFPRKTLSRLYLAGLLSFVQTNVISAADPELNPTRKFLESTFPDVPVSYGVLRGDRKGTLLEKMSAVPLAVELAYEQGVAQDMQAACTISSFSRHGITNITLYNAETCAKKIMELSEATSPATPSREHPVPVPLLVPS